MADIRNGLKGLFVKGMEAIGNTASNIASNTKFKVDEMNLVNRRREILSSFGQKSYEMWQKGEHFPSVLEEQLEELSQLDEQLNMLRAERLANLNTASQSNEQPEVDDATADNAAAETETGDDGTDAVPEIVVALDDGEPDSDSVKNEPLSDAINDLFEKIPTPEEASEKVNGALDSIEETLQQFSDRIDDGLKTLQEKLNNND